jgi:LemA protein
MGNILPFSLNTRINYSHFMEFNGKLMAIIVVVIVLVSVLGFGLWWMLTYNKMVNENENIDAQWAQVTNAYQRKFDLIPQLMNITDSYLHWEASTYANITSLRTQWANAIASGDEQGAMNASNELDAQSATIIVTVENYPGLQGVVVVQDLMYEVTGTENRIATERMYYNDDVKVYNSHIKRFPARWVANSGDFEPRRYYESPLAPAAP